MPVEQEEQRPWSWGSGFSRGLVPLLCFLI